MFTKKVVLVTGASSGIGAATAEHFAKEGAAVAIVGRNEDKLKSVAQRCENFGAKVLIIKADVAKEEEAKTIVKRTVDTFGKLDVLVNNAGIVRMVKVDADNILAVYDEVMNTNLRSVIQITNLAAPYLKETKGNIINVSGGASIKVPFSGLGPYSISKAGMDHFSRSAAIELAPFGVRVNTINPGPVATDIYQTFTIPDYLLGKFIPEKLTALGRQSKSSEIAELILFMASDKGRSITGSSYVIDNGALLVM